MNSTRPYLIIPKLIEKLTWGGSYIAEVKNWTHLPTLAGKTIGQSYELFSGTKLATSITDTSDPRFIPELGFDDRTDTIKEGFNLVENTDYINLSNLLEESKDKMPLLIKFTQALGNSFQLHIKHGESDAKWKPKAESWYYFEPGLITFGLKKNIDIGYYKSVCLRMENYMKDLSAKIKQGLIDVSSARTSAEMFIKSENPWQFVNVYEPQKFEVIDLSLGGLHHSWEQNIEKYPLGNVLYEVQEDVMDPVSTIRSFDQGKIKDDGSVREIQIEDYFKYIDTDDKHNDVNLNKQVRNGERILTTAIYSMDILELQAKVDLNTNNSFNHIFVRDGAVEISGGGITLKVGQGHSCYIPKDVGSYTIYPITPGSVVLKTYLSITN